MHPIDCAKCRWGHWLPIIAIAVDNQKYAMSEAQGSWGKPHGLVPTRKGPPRRVPTRKGSRKEGFPPGRVPTRKGSYQEGCPSGRVPPIGREETYYII